MEPADSSDADWWRLSFGVQRSIRYHSCRRAFFQRWHLVTNAVSVLFSSAAVVGLLQGRPELVAAVSVIVTLVATLDLVVGSSDRATLHHDFVRRFTDLERAMCRIDTPTPQAVAKFRRRRLMLEAEEPPVLRVLDVMCHNELLRAYGLDEQRWALMRRQRWVAQFFDVHVDRLRGPAAIPKGEAGGAADGS